MKKPGKPGFFMCANFDQIKRVAYCEYKLTFYLTVSSSSICLILLNTFSASAVSIE